MPSNNQEAFREVRNLCQNIGGAVVRYVEGVCGPVVVVVSVQAILTYSL